MGDGNPSNRDASDFMLEEYKQIVAAFFDLSKQKTQTLHFYLLLATIPVTLIAAIFSLGSPPTELYKLPLLVVIVTTAIAFAGLFMTAIFIDARFEALYYVKTINKIRAFFAEKGQAQKLSEYLVLPISDDKPKFYEGPTGWHLRASSTFYQVILMGILNATYFGLSMINLGYLYIPGLQDNGNMFWFGIMMWIIFLVIHVLGYVVSATRRDKNWAS